MKIINLTPHEIREIESGRVFPSQGVARAAVSRKRIGNIDGIPVSMAEFGEPIDLPDPREDTTYIVSKITYDAASQRCDLVIPGELIRDDDGNPIGCRGFSR